MSTLSIFDELVNSGFETDVPRLDDRSTIKSQIVSSGQYKKDILI